MSLPERPPDGVREPRLPRFAFVVHALTPFHRRVLGLRMVAPSLALGREDGTSPWRMGRVARLSLDGVAEGVILGVTLDPAQMLADQERAVTRMERVVRMELDREPLDAVGLGSLCAVVGGRGEALAERLPMPVTTGGAATAWALFENTLTVLRARGVEGPVAVCGSTSPVGKVVAALLAGEGLEVHVDGKRGGKGQRITVCDSPAAAARGCPVVVGAGPTGGTLEPAALNDDAVLVDVALPETLTGRPPPRARVLAGEAVEMPPGWRRDGWGHLYHLLAGYGPTQVFACLIEPLVLAVTRRGRPFALGRRLEVDDVREFGRAASALGFRPRLVQGWSEVSAERVARPPRFARLRSEISGRISSGGSS